MSLHAHEGRVSTQRTNHFGMTHFTQYISPYSTGTCRVEKWSWQALRKVGLSSSPCAPGVANFGRRRSNKRDCLTDTTTVPAHEHIRSASATWRGSGTKPEKKRKHVKWNRQVGDKPRGGPYPTFTKRAPNVLPKGAARRYLQGKKRTKV